MMNGSSTTRRCLLPALEAAEDQPDWNSLSQEAPIIIGGSCAATPLPPPAAPFVGDHTGCNYWPWPAAAAACGANTGCAATATAACGSSATYAPALLKLLGASPLLMAAAAAAAGSGGGGGGGDALGGPGTPPPHRPCARRRLVID